MKYLQATTYILYSSLKFLLEKLILIFLSEIKLTKDYLKEEAQISKYSICKKSITKINLFSSQKSNMMKKYITKKFTNFLLIIYNGFTSWMNLLTSWNLWFKACVISLWFHDHNHFQFGKWTMQFFIMTSLALNLKVIRLLQPSSFNILPKWGEGGIKKKSAMMGPIVLTSFLDQSPAFLMFWWYLEILRTNWLIT